MMMSWLVSHSRTIFGIGNDRTTCWGGEGPYLKLGADNAIAVWPVCKSIKYEGGQCFHKKLTNHKLEMIEESLPRAV